MGENVIHYPGKKHEERKGIMHYLLLAGAIALEIFATTQLKLSAGFTKLGPSVLSLLGYGLCFFLFSKALNRIDLGIAYATWSAVGIVATSIIAALAFGQKLSTAGIVGMGLILAGVVVVNLFGSTGH